MKTRTLIIIGIVVILVASSSFIALTLQKPSAIEPEPEYVLDIAQEFIKSSPTFLFDGIPDTLSLELIAIRESFPEQYVIEGDFDSLHGGYGDRTDVMVIQVITPHKINLVVISEQVTSAIMDEKWDELNQLPWTPTKGPNETVSHEREAVDSKEHYEIKITGLKDVYIVGERYDFSYILSGYGHPCGSKAVTFPDSNGDTIGSASSASCIANLPMGIFVFDIQKEQGTTYGHVEMKNPGTYTVTVTFDRPSQHFPTTASQEFRVVEE